MTDDDKKLIAGYMGWKYRRDLWGGIEYSRDKTDGFEQYYIVRFDLNDAGLCVQEIQKRGELLRFYCFLIDIYNELVENNNALCGVENFAAWLFNAENFFGAMAAWLKEGKK